MTLTADVFMMTEIDVSLIPNYPVNIGPSSKPAGYLTLGFPFQLNVRLKREYLTDNERVCCLFWFYSLVNPLVYKLVDFWLYLVLSSLK